MTTSSLPLPPVLARWYQAAPDQVGPDTATFIARAANFAVALSRVTPGAVLERSDNPDEYVVLTNDCSATIEAGGAVVTAGPDSLTIVPPGPSRITVTGGGSLARVFSSEATDILALAANAADYAEGAPLVAPLVSWPAPPAGYRLRNFVLADCKVEGSIMRIFRTRNLMINALLPWEKPRDVHRLSPHSHADFEQGSLALSSRWFHHLRYPWTPDITTWRDDLHAEIGCPSLTVIPPTVVHTSRNIDPDGRLVDIFAPPRLDFSRTPGLVVNAADYPLPTDA